MVEPSPRCRQRPGDLWFFDPLNEARPYGWRRSYQPSGTVTPTQTQFSFVYTRTANGLALSYPSGTRQALTLIGYDADGDVLRVNWEGYEQYW